MLYCGCGDISGKRLCWSILAGNYVFALFADSSRYSNICCALDPRTLSVAGGGLPQHFIPSAIQGPEAPSWYRHGRPLHSVTVWILLHKPGQLPLTITLITKNRLCPRSSYPPSGFLLGLVWKITKQISSCALDTSWASWVDASSEGGEEYI